MSTKKIITAVFFAFLPLCLFAQSWKPRQAPLMTRFSKDVNPDHVLSKYPRPQMVREEWLNLNGLWQFQVGDKDHKSIPKKSWERSILVPFPVESALSGIMEHHPRIWYQRTFTIPEDWNGDKILLHFGAVDFKSEVFINGKSMGIHKGGYNPFSFDITSAIKGTGKQKIAVRVFDPTDNGGYPRGKQSLNPGGIMYTPTTGIWQTVWLEPVPKVNIKNIRITPDIDKSVVNLTVNAESIPDGYSVVAKVKESGKVVQSKSGQPNTQFAIPIPDEKLWSPDSPFLYDLEISLKKNNTTVDHVSSYFGMRKISVKKVDGYKKLFLNNKFLFEIGPLDQGFWPDGIYTAPTDEAIKYDLSMIKKFGFNMIRKHIKVEPQRWYYWADKMGLLVWQDMPSANSYTKDTPPVAKDEFASELTRMVQSHWNSPSIVMWVIFNEAQGQHNTAELVHKVEKLDPSRLVNQASGGQHHGAGDVLDIHSYPAPASPSSSTQALACGEYGGIGYKIKGHLWDDGFGYVMIDNKKDYDDLYNSFANDLAAFKTNDGLSAAVYTQTTDVETELNGLMTYDRAVVKGDVQKIKQSNTNVINKKLYLTEILPSSKEKGRNWKYTFEKPDSMQWFKTNFEDASWKTGQAGFGTKGTPGSEVRTTWNTSNIWLRQHFPIGDLSKIDRSKLVLYIHHDDNCEVYINGIKAADIDSYTSGYSMIPISEKARKALRSNGENVMAIHCKQKGGGQYIDAGISVISYDKPVSYHLAK